MLCSARNSVCLPSCHLLYVQPPPLEPFLSSFRYPPTHTGSVYCKAWHPFGYKDSIARAAPAQLLLQQRGVQLTTTVMGLTAVSSRWSRRNCLPSADTLRRV